MSKPNISQLMLATFLQGSERYITGRELLARAKKRGCLTGGRDVAEEVQRQLNAAKDTGLSAEARKQDKYICIPGEDGVRWLGWRGGGWYRVDFSLAFHFGGSSRLLQPRG